MITERLLSERYRFKEVSVPDHLGMEERDARKAFFGGDPQKGEI